MKLEVYQRIYTALAEMDVKAEFEVLTQFQPFQAGFTAADRERAKTVTTLCRLRRDMPTILNVLSTLDGKAASRWPDQGVGPMRRWLAEVQPLEKFNELRVGDCSAKLAGMPRLKDTERALFNNLAESQTSKRLYEFLRDAKFFGPSGADNFRRVVSIVQQQLSDEEYDGHVSGSCGCGCGCVASLPPCSRPTFAAAGVG